jgi:hypothetical protein
MDGLDNLDTLSTLPPARVRGGSKELSKLSRLSAVRTARHEPTIRQNPMVARRGVLDAVDEAVAAVERAIARRDRARFSPRDN